ncbi:HAD family hydrolase [Ascidiaceihabitans sp.]|uniref:HAD family hydrolase n=1 Tax=Ascidiaceihabitans sp. TaxID=1872644 RepID=UPI00329A551C
MKIGDIKGILFDKDGTLLKYEETWAPINRKAAFAAASQNENLADKLLVSTGYDLATKTVQAGTILGAGNSEEIAQAWMMSGARLSEPDLIELLDGIFTEAMQSAVPADNVGGVVRAFHGQEYKLGVASSDSEQAIKVFLDSLGLTPFFGYTAGYNSGYGHKPEPGMFEGFCRKLKLKPSQVAMVGDNPQDMEMARHANAGLCIAVLSGNGKIDDLKPLSDFILDDISQLPELFGIFI